MTNREREKIQRRSEESEGDTAPSGSKGLAADAEAQGRSGKAFRFEEKDGFGVLTFDAPRSAVNILGSATMAELDQAVDELRTKSLRALVIVSGKTNNFIAGADLDEIRHVTDPGDAQEKSHRGQQVFQKLADMPCPTVAAIHGTCVGGGLELALACNFRIAKDDPATKIGLPEVNLGILPAWGGSTRLPRLIGIERALDAILAGKLFDAHQAHRRGIIDRVLPTDVPTNEMDRLALEFARKIVDAAGAEGLRSHRMPGGIRSFLLEKTPVGRRLLFNQARKRVEKRTGGHYPAPIKALEVIEKGIELPLDESLHLESESLGELIVTDVCKNLIFLFDLREALRKDSGVDDASVVPAEIHRVGIVGAGVMGGGIAQLLAYHDLPVRMKDIDQEAVNAGMRHARKVFDAALQRHKLSEKEVSRKMGLISGSVEYSGFSELDFVIEAVVEDLDAKKAVFREFAQEVPQDKVMASNTSSLSITQLGMATGRPEQVVGMHFFNPVHRMPLVEVIRGEKTSDATVATTVALAKRLSKTPIVVRDAAGFLVNRILAPYLNEASLMLAEGGEIAEIDQVMMDFGMPMGPFRLVDEIGIDVAVKVGKVLSDAFAERLRPSSVLQKLYETGRYGKKNGKGFYLYRGDSKKVDPSIDEVLGDLRPHDASLSAAVIRDRMILQMLKEAALCLEQGVVRRPRDVDAGLVFGTGFPPFRGGLLRYCDRRGIGEIVSRFEEFASKYGPRFEVPPLVKEMAPGKRFYSGP